MLVPTKPVFVKKSLLRARSEARHQLLGGPRPFTPDFPRPAPQLRLGVDSGVDPGSIRGRFAVDLGSK